MAFSDTGLLSLKAASAIVQWAPVGPLVAGSELDETIIRAGSWNVLPVGVNTATLATYGLPAAVAIKGQRAYGIAAASLGALTPVAVGSTNGRLIPVCASGITTHAGSGGDVASRYAVGIALKSAVDGDYFPIIVDPQLVL